YQTFGLLLTLIDAPGSPKARATLARFTLYLLRRLIGRHDPVEADQVTGRLLSDALASDDQAYSSKFWSVLLLPLLLASLAPRRVCLIRGPFLLTPRMALAGRSRRYLADASAVQLTRDPDGLAGALLTLAERGSLVPGGQWASHLFIVG